MTTRGSQMSMESMDMAFPIHVAVLIAIWEKYL
jgi:hypothetical protein